GWSRRPRRRGDQDHQPGAAGRRRPWRLRLGRARQAAGGRPAADRGHIGAMNAPVLADGWAEGGPEGARAALDGFWRRIAQAAAVSPLQPSLLDRLTHDYGLYFSPAFQTLDLLISVFSPYQL